jgi:predicted chitinase
LHVKNGRSNTMNSQHLKRLAVDLNFFKAAPDGTLRLTYDVEELRALGEFWEGLDTANRWGGNWTSFKDTPHFERRESAATRSASTEPSLRAVVAATPAVAPVARRGAGLTLTAVGAKCPNNRDDVETVQRLLNMSSGKGLFQLNDGPLKADGVFGTKTLDAIMAFQRTVNGEQAPSGRVEADGQTMNSLCEGLADDIDADLLALAFLRAADKEVIDLAAGIARTMANRNIDTPLRRAHFLAQIGHESGELRFRAEIANGEAYEGRADLGNSMPGDGRRFKGRGLIQLTGRANYLEYGRALGREEELLKTPELIETDNDLCVDVAGWFWAKRGLNALADTDDLTAITKRINGGLNGLEDRRRLLKRTKSLLGA